MVSFLSWEMNLEVSLEKSLFRVHFWRDKRQFSESSAPWKGLMTKMATILRSLSTWLPISNKSVPSPSNIFQSEERALWTISMLKSSAAWKNLQPAQILNSLSKLDREIAEFANFYSKLMERTRASNFQNLSTKKKIRNQKSQTPKDWRN